VYPAFGHGLEGAKGYKGAVVVVFDTLVTVGQSWDRLTRAPFAQAIRDDEDRVVFADGSEGLDDGQTLGEELVSSRVERGTLVFLPDSFCTCNSYE
jgi:hypothetical protein